MYACMRMPCSGLHLTDLVFVEDGNPETIDGLINFRCVNDALKVALKGVGDGAMKMISIVFSS